MPAHELDGADAVLRALRAVLDQLAIGNRVVLLGSVNLQLLPGVHVLHPLRDVRIAEPRRAPFLVNVEACMPVARVGPHDHGREVHRGMGMGKDEVAGAEVQMHGQAGNLIRARNCVAVPVDDSGMLLEGELQQVADGWIVMRLHRCPARATGCRQNWLRLELTFLVGYRTPQ